MEMYEIIPIIEHIHLKVKDNWEQSRLVAWAALSPHQKHPKPLEDFLKFAWENEEVESNNEDTNNEDLESLFIQTKNIERILNNGK